MKTKLIIILILTSLVFGAEFTEVKLRSITPNDLIRELHLEESPAEGYAFNLYDKQVRILINNSTNKVMIIGSEETTKEVVSLIEFLDVPARQISIEVQILEVNKQKVSDLGIDWQEFLQSLNLGLRLDLRSSGSANQFDDPERFDQSQTNVTMNVDFDAINFNLGEMVNLLINTGAAKISSSPRIVTINNRKGSIVDGSHATYVAKYSGYGEVYETKELYTGLSLAVTPSIGEDELISLDMEAKYTDISGVISGNPLETGQILNNHVIVKNNEPFMLGAFKKKVKQGGKSKLPLLGSLLPFLFSNNVENELEQDFLIVVTPTIIDLDGSKVPKD